MTEEETFNRLKRTPYLEVLRFTTDLSHTDSIRAFKEHGWTEEEFIKACNDFLNRDCGKTLHN